MLKLRVSGTKNDLKTFQRWLERITDNANAKFELGEQKEPKQNPNNAKKRTTTLGTEYQYHSKAWPIAL